jgi:hypothetical protein
LAANAEARRCRRGRAVAVRLFATARQRDGAGIAARRRVVQICGSRNRGRLGPLSTPQQINGCGGRTAFRGSSFSPCWWIAKSFSRSSAAGGDGLRAGEGDDNLVLWDFHDLLFHTRSTEGRQANPLGGLYPYAGVMPPPPAVRPRWPGKKIDLRKLSDGAS